MQHRLVTYLHGNIFVALVLRLLLVFVLFSICRLAYYWYNIEFFTGISGNQLLYIFLGGLRFDTSAILYVNILFILGNAIPFKFRLLPSYQRMLFWIFMLTNSIALIANIADIPYYSFTFRRTSWDVFAQFSHEENLLSLTIQFLVDYWYALLFFVALLFLLAYWYKKVPVYREVKINNSYLYYTANFLAFLFVVALFIGGVRGGFRHSTRPITLSNASAFVEKPEHTVLVLNTPFSIIRTTDQKGLDKKNYFSEAQLEAIYSPYFLPKVGTFQAKNVVVFILESFSKEYIGGLNQHNDIPDYTGYTPFLDSLINESLVFEEAFANGKKSIDGLPAVLSGIPAMQSPYILTSYAYNTIVSLPGLLREKGYYTAFFHGAQNGSMGFDAYAKTAKIEAYYGKKEYGNNGDYDGMWGIWDEPFFQFFAKKMNGFKQPFCATVFSISSHHPFKVPLAYEGKLKEGPHPIHRCVHYADIALRRFFEQASRMPWFNNTLFVITADHAFSPHYEAYKNSVDKFSVPLIFYTPDGSMKGYNDSILAQQIDIMPTVLGYLQYDKPFLSFGKDLFSVEKEAAYAVNFMHDNYQFFVDDYLLLYDGKKVNGLYAYKNDRSLQKNIDDEVVKQKVLKKAQAFIQQYNNRMIDNRLTEK